MLCFTTPLAPSSLVHLNVGYFFYVYPLLYSVLALPENSSKLEILNMH